MPAVTADTLTLPRVFVAPGAQPRSVKMITNAPQAYEGEGFPVRRAFAGIPNADLDPFIHMDQMGEVEYLPGEPKGTPWHPHRGHSFTWIKWVKLNTCQVNQRELLGIHIAALKLSHT